MKPLYNQIIRCFFLFTIIIFFISSVFVCHFYTVRAVNSDHNLIQNSQISSEDFHHQQNSHHSSDFCHRGKESLASQDNSSILLAKSSQTQNSVQQKLSSYFDSNASPYSFGLAKQKDGPFVFSGNLFQSQTLQQLSTIVKIE